MIVTLTPNPSLDRALDVEHLEVGQVNRAAASHVDPGGKGINVSRALVAQGVPSLAVLPAGGADGAHLVALLGEVGVPVLPVPVAGSTRSNFTLVELGGATTKVNAPGPALTQAEVDAVLAAVEQQLLTAPTALVAAGSLPAGAGEDFFVRLVDLAGRHGVPLVVDSSGPAFAAAVRVGGLALVKPNDEELAELVGRELVTVGDVVDAALEVVAQGTAAVLVSLGAHGALLVVGEPAGGARTWWAGGPPLVPASTVGAGDTTLAGYLSASDGATAPDERLRTAVAWGRAAVLLPGTATPTPQDVDLEAVRVVPDPDRALALKEL